VGEGEAKRQAVDLFRRLQLPDPGNIGQRYPHQVSGGQLQRAMTAMAMSCRPDLIVFDEPTTALDVTTQIEVLAAIKQVVRESNTAALYISHDLAVVAQMADHVMVLRYGELVEEATTRQMLSDPQMPYTKSLWAVRACASRRRKARTCCSGRSRRRLLWRRQGAA
jgi:ATPase components of various ABC-type transport systems, contain duplicated ATPase